MQATKSIIITLELKEPEAHWLMMTMQNPLHGQTPNEESSFEANMRINMFESIKAELR